MLTDGLQATPSRRDRLVLAIALGHPLADLSSTPFVATLDHDFIGLPEANAVHTFLKRAAADVQRTLRWRIPVSHFETACRMSDANVGVLPEGTASPRARRQLGRPPVADLRRRSRCAAALRARSRRPARRGCTRPAGLTGFACVRAAIGGLRVDCRRVGTANSAA
ncbi:LysR substrate-binding domain-containing protein [Burkholderia sp. BCC0044]|uniref:LysR substrate-binding domain-containing protein n=1 Tax=Burkholderia sp. BCC0044 TaxID=2676295 RepID=UPI00158BF132|nr:LysR substrate-binding domain-containing protein [Burkholderia sp. BCC0044]